MRISFSPNTASRESNFKSSGHPERGHYAEARLTSHSTKTTEKLSRYRQKPPHHILETSASTSSYASFAKAVNERSSGSESTS